MKLVDELSMRCYKDCLLQEVFDRDPRKLSVSLEGSGYTDEIKLTMAQFIRMYDVDFESVKPDDVPDFEVYKGTYTDMVHWFD